MSKLIKERNKQDSRLFSDRDINNLIAEFEELFPGSEVIVDSYNDFPTISIPLGEYKGKTKYFTFGNTKAQQLVNNWDAILWFAERCDQITTEKVFGSQAA